MTNRRSHLILIGLIVALLAGVAALGIPGSPVHKKVTLGLDLQGGLELVLKAVPPRGQQVTPEGMDVAQSVIRTRIDSLGVTEPELRRQGKDQIVIELAGVRNIARARQIIGTTAQLEMYDLESNLIQGPQQSLYSLLSSAKARAKKGTPEQ